MKSSYYTNTLIFIPAYKAEKTLSLLFERLPKEIFSSREILICDDASSDNTFEEAKNIKKQYGNKIRIIKHEINKGYGGNQKFAYRYAIENDFDYVAMLHGDLQYAPEELSNLMHDIISNNADVVFGSRITGKPIKGGMPMWRYLGNKILTYFENFIMGMNLSEFHSGYRVYNCNALKKIDFIKFTDNYYFDTQMLIAFHKDNLKIREVTISTNYGKFAHNISFLKAVWYGINIIRLSINYRFNKILTHFKDL